MNKQVGFRKFLDQWGFVLISTVIASFCAYWGILENFHEGWYAKTFLENMVMLFAQYLAPMLLCMIISILSILYRKLGAVLFFGLAGFSAWFFRRGNVITVILISTSLVLLGIIRWISTIKNKKFAVLFSFAFPMVVLMITGIAPAIRVSRRLPDVELDMQTIQGNGITLTWAPAGPGWPSEGKNWHQAVEICKHLDEDGRMISEKKIDVWRLPTVNEAVSSMSRYGLNSGGVWDTLKREAIYKVIPDKEAPLWDRYSPVIYWWTATEVDTDYALIIAYDGGVWKRNKELSQTYLGFRCVKE